LIRASFELHDLWKEGDVYAVLEEVLEEKLVDYLGKEQTQRLVGYPAHLVSFAARSLLPIEQKSACHGERRP